MVRPRRMTHMENRPVCNVGSGNVWRHSGICRRLVSRSRELDSQLLGRKTNEQVKSAPACKL